MFASVALRRTLVPLGYSATTLGGVNTIRPVVLTAQYGTAKPQPKKVVPAAAPAKKVATPAPVKGKVVPAAKAAPAPVKGKVAPAAAKVAVKAPPKGSKGEKVEKEKQKNQAAKLKEKEKAQAQKEKEKAQKEKEKERERTQKEKEKEKAQAQKEKEKEKAQAQKEKEKAQAHKEKERAVREKEKEKKEAEKQKHQAEVAKKKEYPSRPKSPYIYFGLETRDKVKQEMPNIGITEVMGELGKRWAALPDNQKAKYEKLSQQDKVRFEKELTVYKQKYPDPPKRSMSAYMHFAVANSAAVKSANPDYAITQIAVANSEKWKSLSANEKKKYDDLAAKDRVRYEKEKAKFEQLYGSK